MKRQKRTLFFEGATLAQVEAALSAVAPDGLWGALWEMGRETHGLEYYPPTRHKWHVFDACEPYSDRQGSIDLFEEPRGTKVLFEDGRDPWQLPHDAIGADFDALADALEAELNGVQPDDAIDPRERELKERERVLLQLWRKKMTNSEIAVELKRLGFSPLEPVTITKRLGELRGWLGTDLVPYAKDR